MVKLANRFINVAPEDYIAEEIDMANNPATRVPVVLCIDCSYSMLQNNRIGKLREGIVQFVNDLKRDPIAVDSAEICVICYGGKNSSILCNFSTPDKIHIPEIAAAGSTPLTDALSLALDMLEIRKERYTDNGISFYRPWLLVIDDGDESYMDKSAKEMAKLLAEEKDSKHLNMMFITVGENDASLLLKLSPDGKVHYLKDLKFKAFFNWLSRSVQKTSQSMSGEEVYYEPQETWAEVIKRKIGE